MSFDLLQIRAETFLESIDYHEELESTNTLAVEQIQQPCRFEGPHLILADQQTGGRGRGSNRWWSEAGALTFTLVLEVPRGTGDAVPLYSLAVGLSICEAIEHFAPSADLAVKWPNDVYASARKLSGVLIERPAGDMLAIGIGINANNQREGAPEEVRRNSISIQELVGYDVDRSAVLIQVLQQLETRIRTLHASPSKILAAWRRYDYLQGKRIRLDAYGQIHEGDYLGINEQGALMLETPSGPRAFTGGVIGFL